MTVLPLPIDPARRRALAGWLALALLAAGLLAAPAKSSSPGAPTRGDATAVLRAGLTGGTAILAHNPDANGAPMVLGGSPTGARIDPLAAGAEYCAHGWHAVTLGVADLGSRFPTHEDLLAYLGAVRVEMALDGVPLVMERTPVRPLRHLQGVSLDGLFAFNAGAILAPGQLAVGSHAVTLTVTYPDGTRVAATTNFSAAAC